MCGFSDDIMACAKAVLSFPYQMYILLWQLLSLLFCQGPVVAVGGRNLCGPPRERAFSNQRQQELLIYGQEG